MKIKITGYVDVEDLPDGWHDPDHKSGLTESAYDEAMGVLISGLLGMQDIDIEAQPE